MIRWIRNYRKSTKKLTWENVKNYFAAKRRQRRIQLIEDTFFSGPGLKPIPGAKTVVWREKQVKKFSPICLKQGYCKECYCSFEDGLLYEEKACEGGCYPNWEESKKLANDIQE